MRPKSAIKPKKSPRNDRYKTPSINNDHYRSKNSSSGLKL